MAHYAKLVTFGTDVLQELCVIMEAKIYFVVTDRPLISFHFTDCFFF